MFSAGIILRSSSSKKIERAYIGGSAADTNTTTVNFGSFNVGASGYVVVCTGGRNNSSNRSVSSVSIGGETATILANDTTTALAHAVARSATPKSGSVNVTVTFSGNIDRGYWCGVYIVRNPLSAATFSQNTSFQTSSGSSTSVSLLFPANGVVIGSYTSRGSGIGWTNLTADQAFAPNVIASVASAESATEESKTVTASLSSSGDPRSLIVVSWR